MRTNINLMPGDKVIAFDSRLFKDDKNTPLSITMRKATIIRRYGKRNHFGVYPDLLDLQFDHRPNKESHGHFTSGVKPLVNKK